MPTTIVHPPVNCLPQLASNGRILWGKKQIGQLRDGVWRKTVQDAAEWCSRYDTVGFQAEAVEALWLRIMGFEVYQRYTGLTIRWSRDAFRRNMVEDTLNPAYGRQFFPSLRDAEVEESGSRQLALAM